MDFLKDAVPTWFGAGVLSAGIAAFAFAFRSLWDWISTVRERRRHRLSDLIQLQSLLRASKAAFDIQQKHVRHLLAAVQRRDANAASLDGGYEEFLSHSFHLMDPEEKELHTLIRGYTEHVLRPTNAALLEWVKKEWYFRSQTGEGTFGRLAKSLAELEIHLLMWNAKYEVWIPAQPKHALEHFPGLMNRL